MVIILEISKPVQWKPGAINTDLVVRAWWLWFAVAWSKIPYYDLVTRPHGWKENGR